jgi:protein-disulfide isomerase
VSEYGGKLRVVYMNYVVHPGSVQTAHLYGCAAAKQGKFHDYMAAFWDKGFGPYAASGGQDSSSLGEDNILAFAGGLGLDTTKLKADAKSSECSERIQSDMRELGKFKVNGTPAFFINGKFIGGGIPKEEFKKIIDERLAVAEQSGVTGGAYYDQEIMAKGLKQFRSKRDAKKP